MKEFFKDFFRTQILFYVSFGTMYVVYEVIFGREIKLWSMVIISILVSISSAFGFHMKRVRETGVKKHWEKLNKSLDKNE